MDVWTKRFAFLALNAVAWAILLAVMLFRSGENLSGAGFPQILFVSGALGAVLANYRRLAEIPETQTAVDAALRQTATIQIFLSPIIGGLFALLLWMLFFSGLVQGSLFPKIQFTNNDYRNWHDLMASTLPEKNFDAAKGLVWAFVAGYAERFVPNMIDRLARKVSVEKEDRVQ
jgi:hypothetical protein